MHLDCICCQESRELINSPTENHGFLLNRKITQLIWQAEASRSMSSRAATSVGTDLSSCFTTNPSLQLERELEQRPIKCKIAIAIPVCKNESQARCQRQNSLPQSSLTSKRLFVLAQLNKFPIESKALSKWQRIPVSSTVSNLSPLVDSHGVLRARR